MKKDIIKIKGTKEGLIFYFNTESSNMEDLLKLLEKKLKDGAALIGTSQYSIADENLISSDNLEKINLVFAEHNMIKADIKPVEVMPKSQNIITPPPVVEPTKGSASTKYSAGTGDSVLIYRSIRSGQSLHVIGNVIIMGDVNAGAHIMATGNIIIMGKLKGLAHAGIEGNRETYIVAWQMKPIQIRVADMLSRAGDDSQLNVDYPEIAKIEGADIVIKPYTFSRSIYNKKVIIA